MGEIAAGNLLWRCGALLLAVEKANSVLRFKEGAQRAIAVVGDEPASFHVEFRAPAIGPFGNQDASTRRRVPQLLGELQVLLNVNGPKLHPIAAEVIFQQMGGAKTRPGCKCQGRPDQQPDKGYPTASR